MKNVFTGIDIGSERIRVCVLTRDSLVEGGIKILGTGTAFSRGMTQGYIQNTEEASSSLNEAIAEAVKSVNTPITSASVSISGVGVEELRSQGEVMLLPDGGSVTHESIDRVLKESVSRVGTSIINRRVLHVIPLSFRVDSVAYRSAPIGVRGQKLVADTLLILAPEAHCRAIESTLKYSKVKIDTMVANPLSTPYLLTTQAQRIMGVAIANLGATTLTLTIYEHNQPMSIKVFPIGGSDITQDISILLQCSYLEAERIKHGANTPQSLLKDEITMNKVRASIATRVESLCTLIESHLKNLSRSRLLPSGVIFIGGGSYIQGLKSTASDILGLPTQTPLLPFPAHTLSHEWSIAYALARESLFAEHSREDSPPPSPFSSLIEWFVSLFKTLKP
jgi:cell division protein FtsA